MSIANDAEFFCVQIAKRLELARQQHKCGLELSLHIGKTGVFRYQK